MPLKYLSILALLLIPAAITQAEAPSAVSWQKDLDAARAVAEREQKLLLVHFHSTHCGPCRMLDANVFSQPTVAGAVHSHYVPVKINTDEFPVTAERFGINRVPCDVIITPQGKLIDRKVSPASPMDYIKYVTTAATQHRHAEGRNFATVASQQGTTQPVNNAYANLPVPSDQNSFTRPAPTQPGGPSLGMPAMPQPTTNPHTQPVATAPVAQNPIAAAPAVPQPSTTQAPVANPYANMPTIGTPIPQVTPSAGTQVASNLPPITPEVPAATQPATPTVAAATQNIVAATPKAPTTAQKLPPGALPLGLNGYCPVTLKKEGRWQKGNAQWGCYHRGRTYLFGSKEARDEFQTSGDTFAPALSGIDAVAAIDSGKVVPGKPEFCLDCDGQIYLFSSDENLKKFSSEASRYVTGVRQAMSATSTTGRTIR